PKPTAMECPAKDDACHHCKEVGHWKRNCHVYLAELLKKKKQVGPASSSEKLKQEEAIGSDDLVLPNDLVICLDNCHYAPSITRGVVSVYRLLENGFVQCFTDFGISVSKNNVFYFNAIPSNGIYEIDMHDLVLNVNSIYNVSTKRAKHNLDSTYLWHCHLAHISKKRIEKLQQERILKSTDDESFDQCVSCLSGKMTRKSFSHRPERATDLLGIIHTNVCGPLRHVSRQAYSSIHTTTLPLSFWDYALESATRILNMVPTKKVDKTPYELWYEKVPNLSYLKVWGCEALVKQDMPDKLQQRSVKSQWEGPLEEIQDEDTSPSEITSEIPMEVKGFEPPQEEVILVRRSKRLIGLGQNAYMDKILKRYRMDNSKRGHIPMQERLDLNKTQGASTPEEVKRMQNVPYASAVGSIMYAVRCTRPDVAFAQNITSRFQQNPGECHWTAVKNILKYLRNTKDMFLVYGGNPEAELRVDCYCDAGFETDRDDTKSQTGYVFILNGGAVDWKSSKQSTTAMSATEAEYIAASEAAMEAVWIRKFISGLGIVPTINEPIGMFCDNSAALHFANEPGVQKGTRHYHRRYHYVRECIALGEIRFLKVHTDDNLADPFTKALPKGKLTQHARSMGLRLASSFM
ncbi:retrotransposon protein, putative, ty1-copia subclass, partial [Tanacetum coccineum]